MQPRIDSFTRWSKVAPDLFAVLSTDRLTLMVGWRRGSDAAPVTCAVAQLSKPAEIGRWTNVLRASIRLSTIGRDAAARAAAIVLVRENGGVVFRVEDREPHLKVC